MFRFKNGTTDFEIALIDINESELEGVLPKGWHKLVWETIDAIEAVCREYKIPTELIKIHDLEEKNGQILFSWHRGHEVVGFPYRDCGYQEITKIVNHLIESSRKTCVLCGAPASSAWPRLKVKFPFCYSCKHKAQY